MAVKSLLNINLKKLLKKIEKTTGVKLPRKVISASLNEGVLHIRFTYPKTRETSVEPLPLKTPTYIFKDEKTNKITAIEILDINITD
ncbi:MAG: hypothetical protein ACXQTU_03705 [Candidatus Nezhaarchaeales archaeon]